MKKSWTVAVLAVVWLWVVGCAPGDGDSPSPFPSQVVTTTAPEPSPTPTSKWSGDEQAAVDAVQLSIATWNRIGQSMDPLEVNTFDKVATGDALRAAQLMWTRWLTNGWRLVGDPYFIPDEVSLGAADSEGQRFFVVGCYSIEGTDVVALDGQSQSGTDRIDRRIMHYTVLKTPTGVFLNAGSAGQDETC